MKNITTIFFDIDGTLIDHRGAQNKAIEQIRKKDLPNFSSEKFQINWLEFTKKNWLLFEQGKINFLEQKIARVKDTWQSFNRSIDNKYAGKIINEYVSNYEFNLTSFPHILSTLRYLYKKKYRLGIISNGNNSQQIKKLKKIKAYDLFEKKLIVISEKIGYAKPDIRIFFHAQKISGTNPTQIAFFGDDINNDIIPAKNFHWKTTLIDYKNAFSHLNFSRIVSFKEIKNIY